jgi:hypothetical protein
MNDVSEVLPASPDLDRPLPDLRPLAEAAPLPDVDEGEAEAVALDRELDGWQRSRRLPRPPSAQELGRQTACSSEEDVGDVMEGRGRRVMSCVSVEAKAVVAEEEAMEEEEQEDDEAEAAVPQGADERLDALETGFWKMMEVAVPVPFGGMLGLMVAVMVWMLAVTTALTRPCACGGI